MGWVLGLAALLPVPAPAEDPAVAAPRLVVQLGHAGPLTAATFSADGRFALTAGQDGEAVLWHAATGRELGRLGDHVPMARCAALSPDGALAATCGGFRVRLWDLASGRERQALAAFAVDAVAFSPDGGRLLTGGVRAVLWDLASGEEVVPLPADGGRVTAVAYHPDGRLLATGGESGDVRLWEASGGREVRRLGGHSGAITALVFSADGKRLVSGGEDSVLRWWDLASGAEVDLLAGWDGFARVFDLAPDGRTLAYGYGRVVYLQDLQGGSPRALEGHEHRITAVDFSPDGRRLLTAGQDATARIWDVATAAVSGRLGAWSSRVRAVEFSPDGDTLLTAGEDGVARLWDLATGSVSRELRGHSDQVTAAAFSPDGERLVTGSYEARDGSLRLWRVATGEEVRRFEGRATTASLVFSPDGRTLLVGDATSNQARLWDVETGRELRRFEARPFLGLSTTVDLSADGRLALTTTGRGAELWSVSTGESVARFDSEALVVAFSPDGTELLAGDTLWEIAGRRRRLRLEGECDESVAWAPDGGSILCARGQAAVLFDAASGRQAGLLAAHTAPISSLDVSPDGRFAATGGLDQTVRLWQLESGRELCRLISFRDGTWAVVAPDGRFDTDDLDGLEGLHWLLPDDPLTPLPVEIFLREYYEPGLLARLLAGEVLPPVRALAQLNRLQPEVRIVAVEPEPRQPDRVTVTVEVASVEERAGGSEPGAPGESEAHDLRLFRDGQLVGYRPAESGRLAGGPLPARARARFAGIRLPRDGRSEVELAAYAFNRDRVKSATARVLHPLPPDLSPRRGRAYLVHVGVDAYENPRWNLAYAASDARLFHEVLSRSLADTGGYQEVVAVTLLSERGAERAAATKANFRAILESLAGTGPGDPDRPGAVPGGERLRPARPEDLLIITFSSHGAVDEAGTFYFFPYDIGAGSDRVLTDRLLARAISSDELSRWLRDIDAGELVLVVDACHSAAAVEGEGFKAGPLGSRGLGQLAYDKGMRILAASQADSFALESELTRQGLLTYALVRDGLEAGGADHRPRDRIVELGEWLEYGGRRVPELAAWIARGQPPEAGCPGGRGVSLTVDGADDLAGAFQQPALFDFSRRRPEVVLSRLGRRP